LLVGELRRTIKGPKSEVMPVLRAKDSLLLTAREAALWERAEKLLKDRDFRGSNEGGIKPFS
jgi:hypothetical protein